LELTDSEIPTSTTSRIRGKNNGFLLKALLLCAEGKDAGKIPVIEVI